MEKQSEQLAGENWGSLRPSAAPPAMLQPWIKLQCKMVAEGCHEFFFRHSITSYYYPFVTKKLRNQVTQQISTSDTACNCCCEAFLSPKWPRGGGIFPLFSMLGEDPFGKQSGLPCAKHVMTSEDILRHRH